MQVSSTGVAYSEICQEEEAKKDFEEAQRLDSTIVFKKQIKKDKEQDKDIKSIGKDVKEVQVDVKKAKEFQEVLEELETEFFEKKKRIYGKYLWG